MFFRSSLRTELIAGLFTVVFVIGGLHPRRVATGEPTAAAAEQAHIAPGFGPTGTTN
jgi:hypothetical protein